MSRCLASERTLTSHSDSAACHKSKRSSLVNLLSVARSTMEQRRDEEVSHAAPPADSSSALCCSLRFERLLSELLELSANRTPKKQRGVKIQRICLNNNNKINSIIPRRPLRWSGWMVLSLRTSALNDLLLLAFCIQRFSDDGRVVNCVYRDTKQIRIAWTTE